MEQLLRQIREYSTVSPALETELEKVMERKIYPKKKKLLEADQLCYQFHFIQKGLVRSFYYHDGKDTTYWFYAEDGFFTSWYSFFLQQPSFEYLETLEESEILSINYTDYQTLAVQFPEFGTFARLFTEIECAAIDYYTKSYMNISAREKYKKLIEDIPDIASRVKLGQLASFLGISQETLSRIRAERS